MIIRDTLNTKEKYQELIEETYGFIDDDLEDLRSYRLEHSENSDIVIDTYKSLTKYSFDIFEAKYSSGFSLNDVKEDFFRFTSYLRLCWQSEWGYCQMLNALSIGIMIDIEDEEFDKLVELVDRDNINDYLIDYLIRSKHPSRKQSQELLWKKPYESLKSIIESPDAGEKEILESFKKYLKAWYRSIEIKTHQSKWNIHTGYWSWEAGAVAKILNLKDDELKDTQYYPYDLVH